MCAVRTVAGVVLLRDDNSALLQLRDNKPGLNAAGLWVFPGGHCEPGESIEAGARREFREETGYEWGALSGHQPKFGRVCGEESSAPARREPRASAAG